ncbi:hypothetical protein [Streptomyces griseoaurantiacus]|uniref:hypothetical protein n=2 Tax=Streptomyces griseoaurantiacus TaxID=68213 RepID=UPI0030E48971
MMIALLLRLYPRRYRRENGAEILAVHQEAAAHLTRLGRVRDTADIAAHALRMRLGLTSATAAGRLLAEAGPLAAGAAAAYCGLHLSRWYVSTVVSPGPVHLEADSASVLLFAAALAFVGAVTALTGHRRAGTLALVTGLVALAVAAAVDGPAFGDPAVTPAMALLTAFVLVAGPPDLPPDPGACAAAGAMAAAAWLPLTALYAGALPVSTDYGMWPLLVLAAVALLRTLRTASSVLTGTAAAATASPLLLAHARTSGAWEYPLPLWAGIAAIPLAGALAVALRTLRRRVPGTRD